jgi:chromosome partitioning protein
VCHCLLASSVLSDISLALLLTKQWHTMSKSTMRSIAIMNQKGGVGKTTTAVNVSAALAATGLRVCLVDLDPQAHATLHFGIDLLPDQPSIYQVLTGKMPLSEARRQVSENLWVVGSSLDLTAAELELVNMIGREVILRDKLREDDGEFDFLLVDCPPSLGLLTINALVAVSEVFIPLQPHFLALHGLSRLLETIDLVAARLNHQLKLSGVILCMYDTNTRLAVEVSQDVDDFFRNARGQSTPWATAQTFQTRIRRNVRLAEAPSFGKSIFQYAPESNGAEDYRRLAEEILADGGQAAEDGQ